MPSIPNFDLSGPRSWLPRHTKPADADAHKDAKRLLALHGGSCSVPLLSRLGRAFAVLEIAGEVVTRPSGTPGYVDTYAKNFASRFQV